MITLLIDLFREFGFIGFATIVLSMITIRVLYLQMKIQSQANDVRILQQRQHLKLVNDLSTENARLETERLQLQKQLGKAYQDLENCRLNALKFHYQLQNCLSELPDDYAKQLNDDTIDLSDYIEKLEKVFKDDLTKPD